MSQIFQCPSCSKNIEYKGGDSFFQTCVHCKGRIIVSSQVVHQAELKAQQQSVYSQPEQRDLKLKEIDSELKAGRTIGAIKVFREAFGTDLKSAKEAIAAMQRGGQVLPAARLHPAIRKKGHPTDSSAVGRLISILIQIAVFAAVLYWFFKKLFA